MSHRLFREWLTPRLLVLEFVMLVVPIILFAFDARPAYAAACVNGTMTYGDAPSSYLQACETPLAGLRIGATAPIVAPFTYPCATGLANCNAQDNFLNPLTPIDLSNPQYVWSVPVSNTTGATAYLSGWIDFHTGGNTGSFDASGLTTVTVPSGSTLVTLTWSVPITATPNITTYVRLRLSNQITSTTDPANAYGNGEVEDYVIRTLTSALCPTTGAGSQKFYYVQGTVQGGSGQAKINTYDISTGITTTVFTPPTRTTPSAPGGIQVVNGLGSDPTDDSIYFQDSSDTASVARGIYGYNISTSTYFTLTTDASAAPPAGLSITGVITGWRTAAGSYANGKYYAGVDGDDSGNIYEITLNSSGQGLAGTAARLLIAGPNSGCGATVCNNYGDVLVDGNRMWVTLWQNTPETQILNVYDINSATRLSHFTSAATGFALQLAQVGTGQIYAITSDNGRVYTVTNGTPQGFTGSPVRTIGSVVHDAAECVPIYIPTAVTLSTFTGSNTRGAEDTQDGSQVPPGQITLSWTTASEVKTAGFNLYRSERPDGPYVRINPQLIAASAQPLVGGKYQYVDTTVAPGQTYYYQLEDVELNGTSTRHPAVSATVASASGLGNAGGALIGLGLGALAVAGAGFVILRKRSSVA